MKFHFPDQFFITGTDTGIGKTLVSAMLCLGLEATYWKPVQSGIEPMTDSEWLEKIAGVESCKILPETYKLTSPLSPHLAARIDGINIDLERFPAPQNICRSRLVVEGAGGLMVPLNDQDMMIDLIQRLELPVLVVAKSGLGTINHTVLTIKMLRTRRIKILGVVMNGEPNEENKKAIEHYAQIPVLAQIPGIANINKESLIDSFHKCFARGIKTNDQSSPQLLNMAPIYPDENGAASAQSPLRIGSVSST